MANNAEVNAKMSPNRPKILYLVTSSEWGGAERYVLGLVQAALASYDVLVAAGPSKTQELFSALPPGVRTFIIPGLKSAITPLRDLDTIVDLRRLIDREGVDLVHCNSSKAGLLGALAAAFSRRHPKVVYTAHGWGFLERRSPLFRLAILASEMAVGRLRQATIVLSEAERRVARRWHLAPENRLHLIPHGLDPDEIAFLPREVARRRLSEMAGRELGMTVGTIANAYPAKALHILIEAFTRANLDADLVILGDGPLMDRIRAAREASPLKERIHLPGRVSQAATFLKGFDLFALSSTKEGLPFAVLEAALAGVPIVATKVGALPEMITDGEEGLLVPPGDVEALAQAFRRVFGDQELRAKLHRGAESLAARHSGAVMIRSTLAVYAEILE